MFNKTAHIAKVLEKQLARRLEQHKPLRDLLPLPVGGVADFYTAADSVSDIMTAIQAARTAEVEWLVVGSGSQTIISDFGYPGLLIHNRAKHTQYIAQKGQVLVDSGVAWPSLVLGAVGYDLGGAEPFLLMSGTIGGALFQDRSVPSGHAARSLLREITIMSDSSEIRHLSAQEFYARPRHERGTILVALFQLVHSRHDELLRRIGVYERQRRALQGQVSSWIGPVFAQEESSDAAASLDDILSRFKISSLKVGGAAFSPKRPNFIEAHGRIRAHDIRELVSNAQHILGENLPEPPVVQLRFIGNWQSIVESQES